MHNPKWKKPIWKGYIQNDSIYMIFQKKQNYEDSKKKKKSVARGWEKGRMNKWSIEEFQDPDTNLYNTLMMDTCHYIDKFSKIIQSMILRENLNVNYGLWVRMIHQCSLSLFNIHYQGS